MAFANVANVVIDKDDKANKRCIEKFEQLDNEQYLKDFSMHCHFHKVADIDIDVDLNTKGKKKRRTDIIFRNVIPESEWNEHKEWIYIITCDSKVIKIGGTRTGLKGRTQSYLCGRPEFRKTGTCSTTNYTLYVSILNLLKKGHHIEMFAKKLDTYKVKAQEFGFDIDMDVQVFHAFESKMLEQYKKETDSV